MIRILLSLLAAACALAPSALHADKLVTLKGSVENEFDESFSYAISFIYNTALPLVLVPAGTPDVAGYTGLLDHNWYGVQKAAISNLRVDFNGEGSVPGIASNDSDGIESGKFASLWFDRDLVNYSGPLSPHIFGHLKSTGPLAKVFNWGAFTEGPDDTIAYAPDTFVQLAGPGEVSIGFAPANPRITIQTVPEAGSVGVLFTAAAGLLGFAHVRRKIAA